MTTELFTVWMKHFAEQTNASIEHPVLLIMDNHSSHSSLDTYLFCREKGIHIVSIPPHTSHRLQPLDLAFFGPLKKALDKECDIFMRCNPNEKITPYDLPSLFNKAYSKVSSVEKATKGFESSGIWPLNPDTFGDEDFMASENLEQASVNEDIPENVMLGQELTRLDPSVCIVESEEQSESTKTTSNVPKKNQNHIGLRLQKLKNHLHLPKTYHTNLEHQLYRDLRNWKNNQLPPDTYLTLLKLLFLLDLNHT